MFSHHVLIDFGFVLVVFCCLTNKVSKCKCIFLAQNQNHEYNNLVIQISHDLSDVCPYNVEGLYDILCVLYVTSEAFDSIS